MTSEQHLDLNALITVNHSSISFVTAVIAVLLLVSDAHTYVAQMRIQWSYFLTNASLARCSL